MQGVTKEFDETKFKATWQQTSHSKMKQNQTKEKFQQLQAQEASILEERRRR
jgi:hypothetical protein